jgi:hypothetical protein
MLFAGQEQVSAKSCIAFFMAGGERLSKIYNPLTKPKKP